MKSAHDLKKSFDKASDDYSNQLSKFAAVSKAKPGDLDDVTSHMTSSRHHFRQVSMDYVMKVGGVVWPLQGDAHFSIISDQHTSEEEQISST